MVFSFKLPLAIETAAAFHDSFGESKDPIREARSWVYQILTKKGIEWSNIVKDGGFLSRELDEKGNTKQIKTSLKDVPELKQFIPESDPDYIPELLEGQEVQSFEIKIGTSLLEKLENISAVNRHITISFNREVLRFERTRNPDTIDNPDLHKKELKRQDKENKKYEAFPFEEFLRSYLDRELTKRLDEHEKSLLQKEFDELYPDKEDSNKKKGTTTKVAGTRNPRKKKK